MTITNTSIIKKLLLLFLVVAALYYGKIFLMPLSIGVVLAALFLPFCKWMEKRRVYRGLAVLICLLVFLTLIAGVGAMLAWQVSGLTGDFTLIKSRALEAGARLQQYIFDNLGIPAVKQLQILKNEQPSITDIVQIATGSLVYIFTNFILVLAYIFLFLYFRTHIRNFLLKLSPPSEQSEMNQVINSAARVSQQYLAGLAKMIICLWIMYSIGFSIIGVKNAIFFAVLCGLLEIVPFIGNITGTIITVSVAAVQGAGFPVLAGIVGTYGLVQFIQGWILEPTIVGPQVKINAFATIVALVVGELVWGIPGILLAIPLVAMFKILCDHIESLKPIGFLIGETESHKKGPGFIKKIKRWFR